MSPKQIDWYSNRIVGSIAEASCRCHFEALGYTVESFGIEHIAPGYAALSAAGQSALGNYAKTLQQQLRTIPDFLISRIYADTTLNRKKGVVGKTEALLVEAKFRGKVTFNEVEQEFFERYRAQIESGMNVLVYLIAPVFRRTPNDQFVTAGDGEPYVHLCLYAKSVFGNQPTRCGGFIPAGHPLLAGYSLYQGNADGEDFDYVYREVVAPALDRLLSPGGH